MNFLAHLYLSGRKPAHRAGGFLADFIKGAALLSFPIGIQQGVWLHRRIDAFTDSHIEVLQAVNLLKPALKRYASVATDILFDHFFAKEFGRYTAQELPPFVLEVEQQLSEQLHHFPPKAQTVWGYCTSQNWLLNYAHWQGVERSFHGMTKRTGQKEFIESLPAIQEFLPAIHQHFDTFWPQVVTFSAESLATLPQNDAGI